ncbi:cryptochrome/photolyase family protein [Acidimangrovimonas pyrenivorans]|uniref:Cryptochrome/photolyase family protein n=1 Tax=Acidimangrovimonas pyrenivorans TaxID=2030798 RepID=A0ABV7AI26_9RHOB
MTETTPILCWLRRDLRRADHPMLAAAAATGRPVIPVFLCDECVETLGAAPKWRLGEAVGAFGEVLEGIGSGLVLRRGRALEQLQRLIEETGAGAVWWSRLYDPAAQARDTGVKAALRAQGIDARSFPGHLLHEPWTVRTGQGGYYKVYTPYWKAVRGRPVEAPLSRVTALRPPAAWPPSDNLADWALGAAMRRGAAVVARHAAVGEAAAEDRLAEFLDRRISGYRAGRDLPAGNATSRLSENLVLGEIGPRRIWHAARRLWEDGIGGAETFLKELVWREFAYHLLHHFPELGTANWRPEWDGFPWRGDNDDAERWRRGMTGEPFVDAALREMYVTGTMHNRARMVAASYLTKHLLTDWRVGREWFEDCLIDWDPASNAMGWQWVAGCGPDAAPYFRIFNPAGQAEKFDPDGAYRRRFVAELSDRPGAEALAFFDAVPGRWGLRPDTPYPAPLVDLAAGRARALAAYQGFKG